MPTMRQTTARYSSVLARSPLTMGIVDAAAGGDAVADESPNRAQLTPACCIAQRAAAARVDTLTLAEMFWLWRAARAGEAGGRTPRSAAPGPRAVRSLPPRPRPRR